MIAHQIARAEILALPAVITLATLARCLDLNEPTVRSLHRSGELERLGIRVNRLGAQYRVITSSVWDYLGLPAAQPCTLRSVGEAAGGDAA